MDKNYYKTSKGYYYKQTRNGNKRISEKEYKSVMNGNKSESQNRNILPKLRKIDYSKKKHRYKLNLDDKERRLALNEGVESEEKTKGTRKAATSKKSRLNILRIYRKNNNPKECNIITRDMKYLDKKYNLGKTKNICKKNKK